MINANVFTRNFVGLFPEYKKEYMEHLNFNDELLPHVFFGDSVMASIIQKLNSEEPDHQIYCKRFFDFLEQMMEAGAAEVRELITVTILARIGDEREVLRKASGFFGAHLAEGSKEIEAFWRREEE